MSRYTGPSCKKCTKVSQKLFLKGTKCHTNCQVDKAQRAEKEKRFGGGGRPNKMSDYAKHLRQKQIARLTAQVTEAQFKRFSLSTEIHGEFLAIDHALARLQPGDLCLVLVDQVEEALAHLRQHVEAAAKA